MKKKNDLSALGERISHKTLTKKVNDRFNTADSILGVEHEAREKVVRKSAAVTLEDLATIQDIKDRCLNYKVVLNDSEVIRLGILLAATLNERELIEKSKQLKKHPTGRPKGT